MFHHVRVIGGAVDCEIECNFQPAFSNFLFQPGEILQRPEGGINVLVPATVRQTKMSVANGIRHAGIIRLRDNRIVSSFAVSGTDGMDWREIDDVKSHCFGVLDPGQTIAQLGTTLAATLGGTRKEFVPSRSPRFQTVNNHARRRSPLRGTGPIRIGRHQNLELARMDQLIDLCRYLRSYCLRDFAEPACVMLIVCASCCFLDQRRTFERFTAQRSYASFELGGKFVLPASKSVNPSLHRILVNRIFIKSAGSMPAIVID